MRMNNKNTKEQSSMAFLLDATSLHGGMRCVVEEVFAAVVRIDKIPGVHYTCSNTFVKSNFKPPKRSSRQTQTKRRAEELCSYYFRIQTMSGAAYDPASVLSRLRSNKAAQNSGGKEERPYGV